MVVMQWIERFNTNKYVNSMNLTSFVSTELANTMKYGDLI